jgi:CheY-like chemotaxis protein
MQVRVLLVEDSGSGLALLQGLLSGLPDMQVVATAASEPQARDWLQAHPADWDLAIVDLVLEQGSGLGVLRQARQRGTQQKVVVLSAYATPGMRQHCLRLGADATFDKGELAQLGDWLLALVRERRH